MQASGLFRFFDAYAGVLLGLASSAVLAFLPVNAHAQDRLLAKPYPYLVIDQDLRTVLREFGRNIGVGMEVSKPVSGVVRGMRSIESNADGFLRRLAEEHDLVWYVDRNTLFVSTRSENGTELLSAASMNARQRQQLADEWMGRGAGIEVASDKASPSLLVTGPATLRERIAALAGGSRMVERTRPTVVASRSGVPVTVHRGHAGSQQVVVPR